MTNDDSVELILTDGFDSGDTSECSSRVGGGFWPASLADLDGNGDLEVIVMSNDDNIHVWHHDGTPMTGWPPDGPFGNFWEFDVSSPTVADIDGDEDMEVVAEVWLSEYGGIRVFEVYAFHHDGALVGGWPKAVSTYSNSSPAIADMDRDGDVEILVGSDGLFVWDLPGAYSEQSADWPFYRHDIQRTGFELRTLVFADGFESGDVTAWSSSAP